MDSNRIGIVLVAVHIICCILIWLGIRSHLLKVKSYLMPVAFFVPVWGMLCILILHFQILIHADKSKSVGMEKLQIDNEIFKTIPVENDDEQKEIIPLEEALLINDPKVRRNMMMDILNSNPEEYLELLNRARMNEDVEVVHYAATAMAELSKQYDFELQKREMRYSANTEDAEILDDYCSYLKFYMEQGMAKGRMSRSTGC